MAAQGRKATWCFRPPAERYDELMTRTLAIAKAKGFADGRTTGFNKLIASYVIEGIDRDWADLGECGKDPVKS